ncbi:MAG: NADH-quinone oxidoreductase subunit J [Pirellulales bacterium]|nr:NADH-quinone oxidoreductase subunit J [Pirellulales bacterium]
MTNLLERLTAWWHAYNVYVALVLVAVGLYLLLPRRRSWGRAAGAVTSVIGMGLLAARSPAFAGFFQQGVFWSLAAVTISAAAATVTFRNPVYCAIWFALALLGTAALFFYQGAQFLGVATVVVYAGAILVTFLFVLMLANPKGQAYYDRISWEAWLAAPAAAVLLGVMTVALARGLPAIDPAVPAGSPDFPVPAVSVARAMSQPRVEEILATDHMAHLGGQLFSRYLLAIEIAGTLLLVALVGAVAIVVHEQRSRATVDAAHPTAGHALTPAALAAGRTQHDSQFAGAGANIHE